MTNERRREGKAAPWAAGERALRVQPREPQQANISHTGSLANTCRRWSIANSTARDARTPPGRIA